MVTVDQARREAWERGELRWKLRPVQEQMYHSIRSSSALKHVINSARRLGKSYLACAMAVEDALTIRQAQIRFAAPTAKALRKFILPHIRQITVDIPRSMRPEYNQMDSVFYFPTSEGEIHLAGVNNGHEDDLRGTGAHKFYIEEAGQIDNLHYLIEDIAMPQLLTTRRDKNVRGAPLVIISTPPKTPAHDFVPYAQEAEAKGNYSQFTIYEAGYPKDLLMEFMAEAGGEGSTTWQREYLCQFVVDENFALVPEWNDSFIRSAPLDEFYTLYRKQVGMDIGVADLTVAVFGYYDFKRGILFIQDEFVINGPQMTTDKVAAGIKAKERELWCKTPEDRPNIGMRIADNNNLLLLQDLGSMHGMHFSPTNKDELEAMVNHVRLFVKQGRLVVDPKCTHVIGGLKYGIWDERRLKFARSSVYGHFDGFAALMYLIRNLDTRTNPIPALYAIDKNQMFVVQDFGKPKQTEVIEKMLGLNRRNRGI